MRLQPLRRWVALVGPLFFALFFTAGPEVCKALSLAMPKWLTVLIASTGGCLLTVAAPLLQARIDDITQHSKQSIDSEGKKERAMRKATGGSQNFPLLKDVKERGLFGIHPSIPLPRASELDLPRDFPTYIPRDIDADLHAELRSRSGTGGIVLIVGRAASGKSRCAYEAAKSILGDWRLYLPSGAEEITTLIESEVDLSRTVIWINEAQNFLGPEKLAASSLRKLLFRPHQPVILLGTLWPEEYAQLRPITGRTNEDDPYNDSRQILELAARFELDGFTSSERRRAESLALIDPRIREAIEFEGQESPTEILAAKPELLYRWKQADNQFGAKVITAAVVARMCGYQAPIPSDLLRQLTVNLMTTTERALAREGWYENALGWACTQVRGGSSPVNPTSESVGRVDGFRASDVLFQHSVTHPELGLANARDRTWHLLLRDVPPHGYLSICMAAAELQQVDAAEEAASRAWANGFPFGFLVAGTILEQKDRKDDARRLYQRAAQLGHVSSMTLLGLHLIQRHELQEAEKWLQQAADKDSSHAMGSLGVLAIMAGDNNKATHWARKAVDHGSESSVAVLGKLLIGHDDAEAEILLLRAAQGGSTFAMADLGRLYMRQDRNEAAHPWLEQAAEAGDTDSMVGLGLLAEEKSAEAYHWFQRAADSGNAMGMTVLGVHYHELGELAKSRTWLTRGAESGNKIAASVLVEVLNEIGDHSSAEFWGKMNNASEPPESKSIEDSPTPPGLNS